LNQTPPHENFLRTPLVAKQCLWPHCVTKKTLKLDCFLSKVWDSSRPVTSLGHQGAKSFLRGSQIF